jgi:hypothetical protein
MSSEKKLALSEVEWVETSLTISRLVLVQRALHPQPRTIQHVRITRKALARERSLYAPSPRVFN